MSLRGDVCPERARLPRAGDDAAAVPTYLIEVVEHRTYEIDADSEAAAIERASADPEQLPIGSLVSLDRRPPRVVPAEHDEPDGPAPAPPDTTDVRPPEFVRPPLSQPPG